MEEAKAPCPQPVDVSKYSATQQSLPSQFEYLAANIFLNLIVPYEKDSLFCQFYDRREELGYFKLPKQDSFDPKEVFLFLHDKKIKESYREYFKSTGFYNPKEGTPEQFFQFIFCCYLNQRQQKNQSPQTQKKEESKAPNIQERDFQIPKTLIAYDKTAKIPLLTQEEKRRLKDELSSGHESYLQKKINQYCPSEEQQLLIDKNIEKGPQLASGLMLWLYERKNRITPDFVFTLQNDRFIIDELLLDGNRPRFRLRQLAIQLIEPKQISSIYKISTKRGNFAFVGEVTMKSFDISNKILILDQYLFHSERYFGSSYTVFGVLVVDGVDSGNFIEVTLSMIPENTRVGKAYQENRLIVLKIPSSGFYGPYISAKTLGMTRYVSKTFLRRFKNERDLYEQLQKVSDKLLSEDESSFQEQDFRLGKNAVVNEFKNILGEKRAALLEDCDVPLFKFYDKAELQTSKTLQLKEKLPITEKLIRELKLQDNTTLPIEKPSESAQEEDFSSIKKPKLIGSKVDRIRKQQRLKQAYKLAPTNFEKVMKDLAKRLISKDYK